MMTHIDRRTFLKATAAGCTMCFGGWRLWAGEPMALPKIISPGCRRSKVKVARIYLGRRGAHWPSPSMDLDAERKKYDEEMSRRKDLADIDFFVDELVSTPEEANKLLEKLRTADGILVIHLSMGVVPALRVVLSAARPTMLFAAPYSGHEWTAFGKIMKQREGSLLDCMLTADYDQLAAGVRPFRAIHHMREAKIVNVTARELTGEYLGAVREKYGTQVVRASREQMLEAYNSISDADAEAETQRWIKGAEKIVEPDREEIFKSCKLALASQKLLDQNDATMITIDCYGSMWRQLPAYPCIGHARLNNMGLGGMCESDIRSCMTQILLQSLSGKPGFVNDPTMDSSRNAIILAHCMGTPKMDGPDGETSRYRLRTVMERQEGCVCQVFMRLNQKVTTAELLEADKLLYFGGEIIETPDVARGCRTKIAVKVDGDAEKLWRNWTDGLHRVTCYGDWKKDLERFCRFKEVNLVEEA